MGIFGGKKKAIKKTDETLEEENVVIETVVPQGVGSILLRPRVTEKATLKAENGVYIFEVAQSATKQEIKKAIQSLYKVNPRKVNIVRNKPQVFFSRMRGRRGQKSGLKKAYVYLNEGDRIDII